MDAIKQELDKLADYQAERQVLAIVKQEQINKVLTPEIKQALSDIDAEFSEKVVAVDENINALTDCIKQAILEEGVSIKGTFLHAIYVKGRVSWDTKGLDGYAVAHPEMAAFRKVGDPSVSIRDVK
jgi:hypothetical protein